MRERFKNWLSTTIGAIITIGAFILWFIGKIDATELGIALTLGWTYLAAKNSLLSGVTCGLIKPTEIPNQS